MHGGVRGRGSNPPTYSIHEQTEEQDAAFFLKQWGAWGSDGVKRNKKANGKLIMGKVYQTMPE